MTGECIILLLLWLFPQLFSFPLIYFVVFLEDGDLNLKKPQCLLQKKQQLKSAFV